MVQYLGGHPRFVWRDSERRAYGPSRAGIRSSLCHSVLRKLQSARTTGLSYFHIPHEDHFDIVWVRWFLRELLVLPDGSVLVPPPTEANPHGYLVDVIVFTDDAHRLELMRAPPSI